MMKLYWVFIGLVLLYYGLAFLAFPLTLLFIGFSENEFLRMLFLGIIYCMPFMILCIKLLPNLIVLGIFLEILFRPISKKWLLVCIIPYALYYGVYFKEIYKIHNMEKIIEEQNLETKKQFQPEKYDLILDNSNASEFISTYKIPVIYVQQNLDQNSQSSIYTAYRLMGKENCLKMKSLESNDFLISEAKSNNFQVNSEKEKSEICILSNPEKPKKPTLRIDYKLSQDERQKVRKFQYSDKVYQDNMALRFEDKGSYYFSNAYTYMNISPWPLIFSFSLNFSGQSPTSGKYDFRSNAYGLGNIFNIEPYTLEELQNFQEYPETLPVTQQLLEKAKTPPSAE